MCSQTAFGREGNVIYEAAKSSLPDGESNPGLPRDRRGYLPLYYRGLTKADAMQHRPDFSELSSDSCATYHACQSHGDLGE